MKKERYWSFWKVVFAGWLIRYPKTMLRITLIPLGFLIVVIYNALVNQGDMKKISEKFLQPTKVYHIYAREECLYNNLSEKQFNNVWETLRGMVGLMKTEYDSKDLSYRYSEVGKIID